MKAPCWSSQAAIPDATSASKSSATNAVGGRRAHLDRCGAVDSHVERTTPTGRARSLDLAATQILKHVPLPGRDGWRLHGEQAIDVALDRAGRCPLSAAAREPRLGARGDRRANGWLWTCIALRLAGTRQRAHQTKLRSRRSHRTLTFTRTDTLLRSASNCCPPHRRRTLSRCSPRRVHRPRARSPNWRT